ncbi:MAG: GAF domain-containing protein, partial [Desulfosalsimonas sp.]
MKNIDEISLLYEISRAINRHSDLKKALYTVLDILSANMNMSRGMITILNPLSNEISIEVAHGISRSAMQKGVYKLGEGVTGRVIQTGEPVTIPKISESPQFLDRTGTRGGGRDQELSFICVPIKKEQQVIGALGVDLPYEQD